MTSRKSASPQKMLTEVELELMGILWRLNEGTVNDVIAALPAGRKLAYTSVSTMMRILEQKGIVKSRKEGRGHVYVPVLAKEKYETATLQHLVAKVFDGAPSTIVRRLLEAGDIDEAELIAIRGIVEKRLK